MIHAVPVRRTIGTDSAREAPADWRSTIAFVALLVFGAAFALACLLPCYLALLTSLQSIGALVGLAHWPATPSTIEWLTLLADMFSPPFTRHIAATLAGSFMVVLVSLFLGVTADYAFGRTPFRRRAGTLVVLGATLLPQVVVLSSVFEVARTLHLYNHWWALTMPYLIFTLPFAVWAVMVFTSRPLAAPSSPQRGVGRRMLWPILAPSLLATALVAFIAAWSEFMFSLTFVLDNTQRSPPQSTTLPCSREQVEWAIAAVLAPAAVFALARWRRRISAARTASTGRA